MQQLWRYLAASETARWGVVSNYAEIRLYCRAKTSNHLHRVEIRDLGDPVAFAEFFAIFQANSLLREGGTADRLLEVTGVKQAKVGEELYQLYAEKRLDLIRQIQARGVDDLDRAIRAAQKLLDRILFIAFAQGAACCPRGPGSRKSPR